MQIPLEISTRQLELSPDLEADLQRRAAKLERHYDRVTSCRVAVEGPGEHRTGGGLFRVRLDITVPGSELVADKQDQDLNLAIRDAFQAAERQIDEIAQRRRGEVKTPAGLPEDRGRLFEEPQDIDGLVLPVESQEEKKKSA
jgi:ribosomal subunit interface protein